MAQKRTASVVQDGEVVLTANELGFVLNEHGIRVAEVVSASQVAIWDTHVCTVDDFGNVSVPAVGFLGTIQDGQLFDKTGKKVGEASGILWAGAGAALLAINSLYPGGASTLRQPKGQFVPQPEPFKVVQSKEVIILHEPPGGSAPWEPYQYILALAAVSVLCMGLMVAAVFVLVTIPIWAVAFTAALIATNSYVKQHILEFEGSDFIWIDLRAFRAVKRKSVLIGLSAGLLISSLYVFAAPDLANALCCLGAVAFALILMWWFLDRYGQRSVKTHVDRVQSSSTNVTAEYGKSNWLLTNSNFSALGSAAVFGLGVLLAVLHGDPRSQPSANSLAATSVSRPSQTSQQVNSETTASPNSASTSSHSNAGPGSSSSGADYNDLAKVDEFNLSVQVPKPMLSTKEIRHFSDRDHLAFKDPADVSVSYWIDVSKGFNDTPSWDHATDLDRRFKIAYKERYRQIRLERVDQGTILEFELTSDGKTLHKLDLIGKTTGGRDLAVLYSSSPETFEGRRELAMKLIKSVEDYEDPGDGRNPVR